MYDLLGLGIDKHGPICDKPVMPELHPAWQHAFAQLERARDNAELRSDALQGSLDEVSRLLAKQGDTLSAIQKMLRRRETQLKTLELENRKLRRALGLDEPDPDADAAPVPDRDDEPADGDEASGEDTADADTPSDSSGDSATRKRRPRSSGRKAVPAHLPGTKEHHKVDACDHCGCAVNQRDVLTTTVYSVVASYVRSREISRERCLCKNPRCGRPTTALMPPMPCKNALYDCGFIAWLVTMKFAYMMPLDRMQALLASQGVHIATGTLVALMERATMLADAVDGEHMKQLREGKYLCFDGTGLKVLMPGQSKAWDGYLEVYTREELTVFQFDLTKHSDELRARLHNLSATLVTDAESRNMAGAPDATFAFCNAHVVRKLKDAKRVQPLLAVEGLKLFDALYDREEQAKTKGLRGHPLTVWRVESLPHAERLKQWMTEVAECDLPPSDPVKKAARYYLNHIEGLTRFLSDPDLPIDNNEAEREFQRHAKLRLASLFAGSVEGAHRWATLLGVVRTAQKHGLDVQAYLTWLFERRGTHRHLFGLSACDLTPEAYKAAGCPGSLRKALSLAA